MSKLFPKGAARPVLIVLTGPQVGQRIRLEYAVLIGRDPECDLMLTDEHVIWHHARVEPRLEGWAVVDLTEDHRTEVNGVQVSDRLLEPDDRLLIGGTVVRFEFHGPAEQAYDEAVLERLNKDDLTGLLARRKFDSLLMSALLGAARSKDPLALIVLDIDGLKAVNDRHGHHAGARVITEVGGLVDAVVGKRGLSCRLGGDEFGIALPGHDGEGGVRVAESVRQRVASHPFQYEGEGLTVRVSAGVSVFPMHGAAPVELLRSADEALYAAKRGGGDRVHLR